MSCYFPDASKAVELFHILHRMKDKNIFKDLQDLCRESSTLASAKSTRVSGLIPARPSCPTKKNEIRKKERNTKETNC